jgi:hypothetical protein
MKGVHHVLPGALLNRTTHLIPRTFRYQTEAQVMKVQSTTTMKLKSRGPCSTAWQIPHASAEQRQRRSGTFKDYDLGFVHLDIKHLPKLQTANGERRKRYLYVAIDRCSRWVHLAVKDDELTTIAGAFLKEAVRAFPFKVTHVLTDRGSCFTADDFEAGPSAS